MGLKEFSFFFFLKNTPLRLCEAHKELGREVEFGAIKGKGPEVRGALAFHRLVSIHYARCSFNSSLGHVIEKGFLSRSCLKITSHKVERKQVEKGPEARGTPAFRYIALSNQWR
jgi:hypothetical protein